MDSSSSSSYDKFVLSSSSDDEAELILSAVTMVMKAIVEDADEWTSQPQPKPKLRKYIVHECETANDLLVSDYFSPESTYDERLFRRRFRMSKKLFLRISKDLEDNYAFFRQRPDEREHHAKYHGLPGMIGNLDCMKWEWELCPTAWQSSHTSGYHGMPAMMLEAVTSQDLWICHALFDGTLDSKRMKFNKVQMVARKDIERAFGVLQKRWRILSMHCRLYEKDQIRNMKYVCIILHNMILEDEWRAIVEYYGEEPESNHEDMSDEERTQNQYRIESRQISSNLRADLVEHVSTPPRFNSNEDD
ncbi:uncharacterized protein LOC110906572 [Helianthus annuus]|uniref:uncharacterized protein LOC110906572 n=1 Tax=Helianthus annuus TaxID=4232 RepID=UPI001652D87D|nr:uncharacterized protein LOC110906572 [Helianthus annuus]